MPYRLWQTRAGVLLLVSLMLLPFQNCGAPGNSKKFFEETSASSNADLGDQSRLPAPATSLHVHPASNQQIGLQWTDNSDNETGFRVERANAVAGPFVSGMGAYVLIATVGPNVVTYADVGLQANTTYYYRVIAQNAKGKSDPSNEDSTTTLNNPTSSPAAPSNLAAMATAATVIALSWTDNSNNESSFRLERSSDGGATFGLVAAITADQTSYQDVNLMPATTYSYRVRASNSIGDSPNSPVAGVTTLAAANTATFTFNDANVFQTNCVSCHHTGLSAGGVNLDSYARVVNYVSPGNSTNSQIYTAINSNSMPPGAPLSSLQKQWIKSWIDAGAQNN